MLGGLQRRMSFAIPTREEASPMAHTAVTPSPGFISIAVSDVERSAAFYVGASRRRSRLLRLGAGIGGVRRLADRGLERDTSSGAAGAVAGHDEHPGMVASERSPGPLR